MCRLFAVTASAPTELNTEVGRFLESSEIHKHGWGYADFTGHKVFLKREIEQASESAYVKKLLSAPFSVQNAMFHIRYATVGSVELKNTHPVSAFDLSGRTWTIIHNGTIFSSSKLDPYFYKQTGRTDTERLLLYLIDRVNAKILGKKDVLSDKQRFEIVRETLAGVAEGNKLNVIINDTDLFYVHANSRTGSRALGKSVKNDYLFEYAKDGCRLFSTVPLDERDWRPIPLNTVSAYRDGALVFQSEPHTHEYVEKEEDLKYLYLGFSEL
jgi:glutamine amidotransferase